MKLATYLDGSRDGQLVVVSRDLSHAHFAAGIATRMAQLLDDWNFVAPQLEDLSVALNHGRARHAFPFDPRLCMAPLPRTTLALLDAEGDTGGALALLPGDGWLGAQAMLPALPDGVDAHAEGYDLGPGVAFVTANVPRGAPPHQALESVRLVGLVNAARRVRRGVDTPASDWRGSAGVAWSPVLATPDELGAAWAGGRVHLTLQVTAQGRRLGLPDVAAGMRRDVGALLADAAATRRLDAGTVLIVAPLHDADTDAHGHATLAARRAAEARGHGAPRSAWLGAHDTLKLDAKGRDGASLFGAIAQRVDGPAQVAIPDEADRADEAPQAAATSTSHDTEASP